MKPGDKVERYEVVRMLGEGGMARVYLARHTTLDTLHAVKILTLTGPTLKERLEAEGRAQAKLRNDNIVRVSDVLTVDGMPALVMDFVEGPDLHKWIREVKPDPVLAEQVFRGIVQGVLAAHAAGHIHRDLKPANVLMGKDVNGRWVPKVGDFGLVKALEGEENAWKTRSGVPMGTPMYMAPEQIRNAAGVDRRADVFALGCILYELLAHHQAFDGADLLDIFDRIEQGRRDPLPKHTPPHLRAAVDACLQRDPDARPQDCRALLAILDGGAPPIATLPPSAATIPLGTAMLPPEPRTIAMERTPVAAWAIGAIGAFALVAGVGIALVVGVALAWWTWSGAASDGTCPTSGGLVGYAKGGGGLLGRLRVGSVWSVKEDTAVFAEILDEGVEAERVCLLPAGTSYTLVAEPVRGWVPIHGEGVVLPAAPEPVAAPPGPTAPEGAAPAPAPATPDEAPEGVPAAPATDVVACEPEPGRRLGWFYTRPLLGSVPEAGMEWAISGTKDVRAEPSHDGALVCRLMVGRVRIEEPPIKEGRGWWVPYTGRR